MAVLVVTGFAVSWVADMDTGIDRLLATGCTPLPQYSHTAVAVGTVVLTVMLTVITVVTLMLLWGRRGR